jgi:hypothetical protein
MQNFVHRWLLLACCISAQPAAISAEPVELIAASSRWRYFKGTAEPTPADRAAWRAASFSDAPWAEGSAPFWYGEQGLFGGTGTQLGDMQNRYTTLYLRQSFSVASPAVFESIELNALCDDGFIAWINGHLVVNRGGPEEPAFSAVAAANAAEPVVFEPDSLPDPTSILVAGENTLAVQVFNVSSGSSDLAFDAVLTAIPRPQGPPLIAEVTPAPGPIDALDQITVRFTEPVRGVRAEDFLINGVSASSVEGADATYTFSFPTPPFGPVEIRWSTFHQIEDMEDPPRRFELAAPGSTWAYELIDPNGPSIIHRQPPSGARVQALTQIELRFDKAVTGIDPGDLRVNGTPASRLTGLGAGPYLFEFPAAAPGNAMITWAADHGIASDALEPHPFISNGWNYVIDPNATPPGLVITEIMAENLTAYRDEDDDPEDWIEIHNPTAALVDLEGWSLSDDPDEPGLWTFPAVSIPADGYLVVFASGKDRRPVTGTARLHTGFKLNPNGDWVGLYPPQLPRQPVSEVAYQMQGQDYSLGRENRDGAWRYYKGGSPGTRNGPSSITGFVTDVQFSVERGFFNRPFNLALSCPTPGVTIRYTTNGSVPTELTGFVYTNGLRLTSSRVIRAAAFKSNAVPSRCSTHTYLFNLPASQLRLPALSLVTATNHLYGRTGIMETNPRNTTQRGPAWERPASVEFIRVEDNGGFQIDCGLRIQGGDYVRSRYNYRSRDLPFSKYSFRLYFRGEYGQGRLEFPLFPGTTQESFDTIVLRAGMNDHSNPFLLDEYVRTLAMDAGQPAAVGTFVHLFLNGVYKGYYNPCERIDIDFLRAYHGGGESWDVMAQSGEVREGNAVAWNSLRTFANTRDLANPTNYLEFATRLDLTNFVDYLCPLIYADNDDWPHNNWRAARERVPGAPYRMYAWDSEWTFGHVNGHSPTWNTIQNQLSSTSPPWGSTEIQRMFNSLRRSPEFRLLFADRVHKHFFNGGALTDERLRARYTEITNRLNGVVPGFDDRIGRTWIPQRRRFVLQHLERAGFLASSNAPAFSRHGGPVPAGHALVLSNLFGTIFYTTNGTDPRVAFTGNVASGAQTYQTPLVLSNSLQVAARSLNGTNWSALTLASFEVSQPASPIEITEIQYNPPGGEAFEFIELANVGTLPFELRGFSFSGIEFRFPDPSPLMPPGARWILANDSRPEEFSARYPEVSVAGWFGGALDNAGEQIDLFDPEGRRIATVLYDNSPPWAVEADGSGPSLVRIDLQGNPSDPAAWAASAQPGGSPGSADSPPAPLFLRLSEIATGLSDSPDWLELNNGPAPLDFSGWSLSDNSNPRRFVFPGGTTLPAGARLRVWCTRDIPAGLPAGSLHTGFGLDRDGEILALYDPSGRRVDIVSFGHIPDGYSLGRVGDNPQWTLCEPTPEAPNEPATLSPLTDLALNEWFPNPPPGGDDWVELHNVNPDHPLPLRGLSLLTSGAHHRIGEHSFVPPGGFLLLMADENPGPGHLGFKLPASGGLIAIEDHAGIELTRVSYSAISEGVAQGRIPDGTGLPVLLPSTASPGASNYTAAVEGPRLNEWMARNAGAIRDSSGRAADWIELHNPLPAPFDLSRATLTVEEDEGTSWVVPQGTVIPANGYLVLWCDPDRPPSTSSTPGLNLGRGLPGEGGYLRLASAAGQLLDAAPYGPQIPNASVGRTGSAFTLLSAPTPGAANSLPATLGSTADVRITEWLADNSAGDDWLELANPQPLPVDLGGHYLTDDPSLSGATKFALPQLSLISPGGHHRWFASDQAEPGPEYVGFSLGAAGETLRVYSPNGALIDSVDIGPQATDVSEGRFPEDTDSLVRFPESASPGVANWIPHPAIVLNEVLTHTDPPLEDAIELYNQSSRPVDLTGWGLSDDPEQPAKYQFQPGLILQPGAYHVLFEPEFNLVSSTNAVSLNAARGGELWLSEMDHAGQLTGYRAHVSFGPAANAISFGRHSTSIGWDFAPQSRRTFGKDAPASINEFRQSTGLPNAYPMVGPVVFSEIHFRPIVHGSPEEEIPAEEFVELQNTGTQPVPLFDPLNPVNTWRISGGIEFRFPMEVTLPPDGFVILVPFATSDAAAGAFRSRYQVPDTVPLLGPFSGRLSNETDDLRLERPDRPQPPPDPDAGFVPYLLVERVHYRTHFPWPTTGNPAGLSLQRRRAAEYANDPANWVYSEPSVGAVTRAPLSDRDFDGISSDWEIAHGLNPDDPADATLDSDSDGLINLAEFIAGTDPRNLSSVLRLTPGVEPSIGTVVRFIAAAGRSYTLLSRESSAFGSWQREYHLPTDDYDREVSIPIPTDHGETRFYRVVTPALP